VLLKAVADQKDDGIRLLDDEAQLDGPDDE
jgi:hypothetical protein